MAPRPKRSINAQNAANARWHNTHIHQEEEEEHDEKSDEQQNQNEMRIIHPDVAVISTLLQGTNYRRARIGAAVCGTYFPSRSTFYKHQKALIPKAEQKIRESIEKKADSLFAKGPINASSDGRYDSGRDAMKCSVAVMACDQNVVIDVETVDKNAEKVSSYMLESKAVRKIFDRVKSKYGEESFETLTTDGDNKTIGQANKAKLVTKRQFDPRNGLKSIYLPYIREQRKYKNKGKIF